MNNDASLADVQHDAARPKPARARPVLSNEDFELLRTAVVSHLQNPEVQNGPESVKYSNLYHRLGRFG